MAQSIEIPAELARFELPEGVQARLQALLDQQDDGTPLTPAERQEAEGLVELAEFLSLLHLRAQRPASPPCCPTYLASRAGWWSSTRTAAPATFEQPLHAGRILRRQHRTRVVREACLPDRQRARGD